MPGSRKADWSAIKREYMRDDKSVVEICREHAVSTGALYSRARRERWIRRNERRRAPMTPAARRAEMNDRLFHVLRQQMKEIESQMDRQAEVGESLSAAERERLLRALSSISRGMDRLTEESSSGESRQDKEALSPTDVDRLRRDLARRLARRFSTLQERGGA